METDLSGEAPPYRADVATPGPRPARRSGFHPSCAVRREAPLRDRKPVKLSDRSRGEGTTEKPHEDGARV